MLEFLYCLHLLRLELLKYNGFKNTMLNIIPIQTLIHNEQLNGLKFNLFLNLFIISKGNDSIQSTQSNVNVTATNIIVISCIFL